MYHGNSEVGSLRGWKKKKKKKKGRRRWRRWRRRRINDRQIYDDTHDVNRARLSSILCTRTEQSTDKEIKDKNKNKQQRN